MRCPSVAGLWSASPPPHCVTAAAALDHPLALFTGGSDGAIVWWRLTLSGPNPLIWPLAILCGHAAPIAGLALCSPSPSSSPALLSACADGVLCVWSSGSGRCHRRRRLPPWAGTPSVLSPLPASPRHVCIACARADSSAGHEAGADGEGQHRRAPKWAVVVVDTCTLAVVQKVFHGSLSIGPVESMAVISTIETSRAKSVILVDGQGNTQILAVDTDHDGDRANIVHRSSSFEAGMPILAEDSSNGVEAVVVEARGKLKALVFGSHCEFKSVDSEITVGEISLRGSSLCSEDSSVHLTGGMFLEAADSSGELETEGFSGNFAVWSANGCAMLYKIISSSNVLTFEPLCEIPALPYQADVKTAVQFCQLKNCLVRVVCVCYMVEDLALWRPHVTVWSFTQFESRAEGSLEDPCLSIMLGEGGFPDDFASKSSSVCSIEAKEGSGISPSQERLGGSDNLNHLTLSDRAVSSSMVLSEDFYAPYALVYGFYNGDIEVVQLLTLASVASSPGNVHGRYDAKISVRFFSGHTGAVICLAAHRMFTSSGVGAFHRVLISGSFDCTIRVWDLDSGSLLAIMHHHVSPVTQIILPSRWTLRPWNDCFLSVGEDCCVALVSLETLRVERMFPGHPSYPATVAWDSIKGYIACLCGNSSSSDGVSVLYLWDVKTGARERVIRGAASHSMFDHFCRGININSPTGDIDILAETTSASSLLLPILEDASFSQALRMKTPSTGKSQESIANASGLNISLAQSSKGKLVLHTTQHDMGHDSTENISKKQAALQMAHPNHQQPVKSSCPYPGIASLRFDLSSLVSPHPIQNSDKELHAQDAHDEAKGAAFQQAVMTDNSDVQGLECHPVKESLEECLLRFSLCFLHLWDVDIELDGLLMQEMKVCKPEGFYLTSGMLGDRGSQTLMFPGFHATLELWKLSSEFSAMRSLTIVSLAQRMISLCRSTSTASSTLAAFYTRNFAEKVPDIKPPLLQLLVSFWQDPSEHVRMAARSLFHCAAPRAIPRELCSERTILPEAPSSPVHVTISSNIDTSSSDYVDSNKFNGSNVNDVEEPSIIAWLDSFEVDDWISYVGGTSQDAMASHIIAAAALVVWYPSIVKEKLALLVVNQLVKLVMSMNDRYSSTAAELLSEGMDSTWKACLGPEIPHLIGDIFFQIECLSGSATNKTIHNPVIATNIREALIGILLPSLAMADITGFLTIIEGQIWATSSDSPVHLVSLKTIVRVVRGSPKPSAPYLDKVVNYVLQTMDHGNLVMRKACLNTAMVTLKEIARTFPMVALNEASTRLAVGDAIGDVNSVTIRVYDIESVSQIKVLDASGPPGLPTLLESASATKVTIAITALSFSPDGEGLVAFSENGLMIRWWSLGSAWWEKLSRNLIPVQCTKLIFVPPWEGFSPNSSRSSIMASIAGNNKQGTAQDKKRELDDVDSLKLLLNNLDLSYRLQWIDGRKVVLTRHGHELGIFQL